jgi:hypothetical protein
MTCQCGCGRTLRSNNTSGWARACRHRSPAHRAYVKRQWATRDRPRIKQQTYARHERWLDEDDPPEVIEQKFRDANEVIR